MTGIRVPKNQHHPMKSCGFLRIRTSAAMEMADRITADGIADRRVNSFSKSG